MHRRNHPMGPVGRVPPTLEDVGTRGTWSPPTFMTAAVFFTLKFSTLINGSLWQILNLSIVTDYNKLPVQRGEWRG